MGKFLKWVLRDWDAKILSTLMQIAAIAMAAWAIDIIKQSDWMRWYHITLMAVAWTFGATLVGVVTYLHWSND